MVRQCKMLLVSCVRHAFGNRVSFSRSFTWRVAYETLQFADMSDFVSRRDWLKTVGVVGAGALVSQDALDAEPLTAAAPPPPPPLASGVTHNPGDIIELTSTSEI